MRRKCDFSDEFVRYVVSPLHKKKETATFMNVTWYSVVSWEPVEVSIQTGLHVKVIHALIVTSLSLS